MFCAGDDGRCLEVAVRAARAAGRLLIRRLGRLTRGQIRSKSRSDYVTEADRESERIVTRIIRSAFPDHAIEGEEYAPSGPAGRPPFCWFIDPLDGTTNYIHGYPMFCVSIGLQAEGEMRVAVVHDPLRGELFAAVRGRGAFLNGRRIHVSRRVRMRDCLMLTGFPFRIHHRLDPFLRIFRGMFYAASGIRRAGSAALDLCFVACGRADGFWEMGLSSWDVAAGSLLVEEAGGRVTGFTGERDFLRKGDIVASNGRIHAPTLRVIRRGLRR